MNVNRKVFNRYLNEAEEKQLMNFVGQFNDVLATRDHAWMILLRQTGMRVGSLCGLTVGDAVAGLASKHLKLADEFAKNKNGYDVFLTDKARKALRKLLAIRAKQGYQKILTEPLIMSRNHNAIAVRTIQQRMAKWVLAAGLKVQATPHYFRHTLAKRIMKNSSSCDPLGVVSSVLNHSSIETSRIYTLNDKEDITRSMEQAS